MDQPMLDVTGIPDLSDGEQITIVGEENGKRITMEEIAAMTDTVHYGRRCASSASGCRGFTAATARTLASSIM